MAGRTYVGKNGRRRCLMWLSSDRTEVIYDRPEGGSGQCLAWTFARWAEREATPEEQAP